MTLIKAITMLVMFPAALVGFVYELCASGIHVGREFFLDYLKKVGY